MAKSCVVGGSNNHIWPWAWQRIVLHPKWQISLLSCPGDNWWLIPVTPRLSTRWGGEAGPGEAALEAMECPHLTSEMTQTTENRRRMSEEVHPVYFLLVSNLSTFFYKDKLLCNSKSKWSFLIFLIVVQKRCVWPIASQTRQYQASSAWLGLRLANIIQSGLKGFITFHEKKLSLLLLIYS